MARPTADANIAFIKWAKSLQHWRLFASFLSLKSPIQNTTFLGISTKMCRTRRKMTKFFFNKSTSTPQIWLPKFIWEKYITLQKSQKDCSFLRGLRWDPALKLETSWNNCFLNAHISLCRVCLLRNKYSQTDNQSHLHLVRDMHSPLFQGIYVTGFFLLSIRRPPTSDKHYVNSTCELFIDVIFWHGPLVANKVTQLS